MDPCSAIQDEYARKVTEHKRMLYLVPQHETEGVYPLVKKYIGFNVNIESMYGNASMFHNPLRDNEEVGINLFRAMMLFFHIVEEICSYVSTPGLNQHGLETYDVDKEAYEDDSNVLWVPVDKNGNYVIQKEDSSSMSSIQQFISHERSILQECMFHMREVIDFHNDVISGSRTSFHSLDTRTRNRVLQNKTQTNAKTKRNQSSKNTTKKKDTDKRRKRTRDRSLRGNHQTNNNKLKLVPLPAVEVLLEKVLYQSQEVRQKILRQMDESEHPDNNGAYNEYITEDAPNVAQSAKATLNNKPKRKKVTNAWADAMNFEMDDDADTFNLQYNGFFQTDVEASDTNKEPGNHNTDNTLHESYDSKKSIQYTDSIFMSSVQEVYKRCNNLWLQESSVINKDPRYRAFTRIMKQIDGCRWSDFTFHVLIRKDVPVNFILRRCMIQNVLTRFKMNESLVTITREQFAWLNLIANSSLRQIEQIESGAEEDDKKKASKPPAFGYNTPNTEMRENKNRSFKIYETHRSICTARELLGLLQCYAGSCGISEDELSCDNTFNFDDQHPLAALNFFSLYNVMLNRSASGNADQSREAWSKHPERYITHNRDGTFTFRVPDVSMLFKINPLDMSPRSMVYKYLPYIPEVVSVGLLNSLYPQMEVFSDYRQLLLNHHHPINYPYDPLAVPPVQVGLRMLTLQETEKVKEWLTIQGYQWEMANWRELYRRNASRSEKREACTPSSQDDEDCTDISHIPPFVREANPEKMCISLRRHMCGLIMQKENTEKELNANRKTHGLPPLSGEELFEAVNKKLLSHSRAMCVRNIKFMSSVDTTGHIINSVPEHDGYLIKTLKPMFENRLKSITSMFDKLKSKASFSEEMRASLMYLHRQSSASAYDILGGNENSNLPVAGRVIVTFEKLKGVREPSYRPTYNKLSVGISNLTNFTAMVMVNAQKFLNGSRPGMFLEMMTVASDSSRYFLGTRLNLLVVGTGACGKGYQSRLIRDCRISLGDDKQAVQILSTSREVTANTAAAHHTDDKGNYNGMLLLVHEMPFGLLDPDSGKAFPEWKDRVDSACVRTVAAMLDDNGGVHERIRVKEFSTSSIMHTNEDIGKAEPSFMQRFAVKCVTHPKNHSNDISFYQASAEQQRGTVDDHVKQMFYNGCYFIQTALHHAHTMLATNQIVMSCNLSTVIIQMVCDRIHKKTGIPVNARGSEILLIISKLLCLQDIIVSEFMMPGGQYYGQPMSPVAISSLEPEMYVNTHHVVMAILSYISYVTIPGCRPIQVGLKALMEIEIGKRNDVPCEVFKPIAVRTNMNPGPGCGGGGTYGNNGGYGNGGYTTNYDWNYVRFRYSNMDQFANSIRSVIKSPECTEVTEEYDSVIIKTILGQLSKNSILSPEFKANPLDTRGFPIADKTHMHNIPVIRMNEHNFDVAWQFIQMPSLDVVECAKSALRDLFNSPHQNPTVYGTKPINDTTPVMETITLGRGLSSRDLNNNIPNPADPDIKNPTIINTSYLPLELMSHLYSDPKELEDAKKRRGACYIEIDMSLDEWAWMMHQKRIRYCDKILSERRMMSNLWRFNDVLSSVKDDLLSRANACIGKTNSDTPPLTVSASDSAIPKTFQSLASRATHSQSDVENSAPLPPEIENIINTYDNEGDVELKVERFTVPVFEDDRHYRNTAISHPDVELKVIECRPHWEVLGLSMQEYKKVYTLPEYREDRCNRACLANKHGRGRYPDMLKCMYGDNKQTEQNTISVKESLQQMKPEELAKINKKAMLHEYIPPSPNVFDSFRGVRQHPRRKNNNKYKPRKTTPPARKQTTVSVVSESSDVNNVQGLNLPYNIPDSVFNWEGLHKYTQGNC